MTFERQRSRQGSWCGIPLRGLLQERVYRLLHLFDGNSLESHVLLELRTVRGNHRHSLVVNVDVNALSLVNVALYVSLVNLLNYMSLLFT